MSTEIVTPKTVAKSRREWWVRGANYATIALVLCFVIPYLWPGMAGFVLWYLGMDAIIWWPIAGFLFLCGIVQSMMRRPFWRWWRVVGFANLLLLAIFPLYVQIAPFLFLPYPSSHNKSPSAVKFRLPFDGPVTVFWGGTKPFVNYHAAFPDQCRAYDLVVKENGKSFRTDGKSLEDYYCFGLSVLAPADGTVYSIRDGQPNMQPGELGGSPAGGNQIVIEVARNQFLFLCHLQPGSISVNGGDRVRQGQPLAKIGNSGNTSEPHLHIHLQDSPDDHLGEGIPLLFHHYRLGNQIVPSGIPTGGLLDQQVVEHVPE